MGDRSAVGTALDAVGDAVDLLDAALRGCGSDLSRDEWLAVVGGSQQLANRITGLQDAAIASVARIEGIWNEDGTVGEVRLGPGRVALDAADLVAPRLGASHHRAQQRVESAVRLTGREPVPADVEEIPETTGLDRLHSAMRAGRIDEYRATVVADELLEVPSEVADAVVTALDRHLDTDPPASLRRRARRMLARVSPDLLRQRAERARRETGLRRWVAEPGVDAWSGTFPSEESAVAWAAVDQLARRYVTDGLCGTIEQARGKALTDLVTQQADVSVELVLTTPAETVDPDAGETVAPRGGAVRPPRRPMALPAARPAASTGGRTHPPLPAGTGIGTSGGTVDDAPPSPATPARNRDPDQVDRVSPAAPTDGDGAPPSEPDHGLGEDHSARPSTADDLVQVHGARPGEPMLVSRSWLEQVAAGPSTHVVEQPCHPVTGARLDPGDALALDGYRPGARLTSHVKGRDGRCRFPGCSVAARFCDLDHVRPWPTGPTAASNLLALCRRHHRVKQAPGWLLRLRPDGVAEWTQPTGAVVTTEPLDALELVVLPASSAAPTEATRGPEVPGSVVAAGVAGTSALPSVLEEAHEYRLDEHHAVLRQRRCAHSAAAERAAAEEHRRRWLEQLSGDPPF